MIVYLVRLPQVRRHWRPFAAGVILCLGVASLLAAVWSPWVARGVGRFVVSPGLGSLAAAGAAALALYGVFRQLHARQVEQDREEERNRADQYAEHFRWVTERVLESTNPEAIPVISFLLTDLGFRAPTEEDVDAALTLLSLHQSRIKDAEATTDVDDEGAS